MKRAFCIIATFFFPLAMFAQSNVVDKTIAVIGKNMLKLSELETSYLQQKKVGIDENEYNNKCSILEGLLINKLMLHQANVDSVKVTEDEITREMDSRLRYMISKAGSKEALEQQLGKSIGDIKDAYKDLIKENILISNTENKLTNDIKITPQDVTEYYKTLSQDSMPTIEDEYEFEQIVKIPIISKEEKQIVKDRLEGYRKRILQGDKFSTLAALYSEDEVSAKRGGELGFFSRGDMVSEFESVAFSLREGEVSQVFETKYGFHIIQMIERRGDQVNCRHILLQPKVSDMALMQAQTKLDSIRELIINNKITFADAVKKYSDDASSLTGGKVINPYTASARFNKNGINDVLQNVDKIDLDVMKKGDISRSLLFKGESSNAYRLLKLTVKVPAHKVNMIDDYDKIYNAALENAKTKAVMKWANDRVMKTYIHLDEEYRDCNFKINWFQKK
jgi:Parvulin-like peptidyl-prolyl isomerase